MEKLSNPRTTREIIRENDFTVQKKYGQNFLVDARVLDKILDAAEVTPEDFVLEIGPGIGTLTQALAKRAGRVLAVEIDRALIPILEDTLSECENVEIINRDILKIDIGALAGEKNGGKPIKVIGNLPYYIATPIVRNLLESHAPIARITVMVQEEVGMRMQAGPGTKEYGALSLAVQYYAEPYLNAHVPPNCFLPRPKVGSAVLTLKTFKTPPVKVKNEKLLFSVIRASFHQRRKTLVNGLKNAQQLGFTKEQILEAMGQAGIPESVRGENLTLAQFAALSDALFDLLPQGNAGETKREGSGAAGVLSK